MLAIGLELISLGGLLTLANIQLVLIGSVLVCGAITFGLRRQLSHVGSAIRANSEAQDPTIISRLSGSLAIAILFLLLAATAFTAMSSIPNTWDSMTYHLPRIEQWLQNKSLEFYPVWQLRQVEIILLAEKLILVVRSIFPSMSSANMVQWFSYAGCILVGNRITRELGGSRSSQCLSSVIIATLPMAILQSSSTQTDLVVAFFSAASVYFLMRVQIGPPYFVVCHDPGRWLGLSR